MRGALVADYHVHTENSIDSEAHMADYCRQAVRLGIDEIVFTEHFDLNPLEPGRWYLDYQRYTEQVEACRQHFGNMVTIKKGLELGEPHLYSEEIGKYVQDKDFDFFLGSVHWVDKRAVHQDYCRVYPMKEAYERYFSEVFRAVQVGRFQVLGHLDLLKRYAPASYPKFSASAYRETIREILKQAVHRGIGLEINTSGLRKRQGETLPSEEILRWYHELGGEIVTIGSDAHRAEDLGAGMTEAHQLAVRCGFRHFSTFVQGNPLMHNLDDV